MEGGEKVIKKANLIFGHICVIVGCYLVAWGIHLGPISNPTPIDILSRPLFWGFFSILGGICANVHGYCKCVQCPRGKEN